MSRHFWRVLVVFALLLSTVAPAVAQDRLPDEGGTQIFLPFLSGDGAGSTTSATQAQRDPSALSASSERVTQVNDIHLTKAGQVNASGVGTGADLRPVSVIVVLEEGGNPDQIAAATGGTVVHRYQAVFNGLSMLVGEDQLEALPKLNNVKAVYLDTIEQLDTDASPSFIGAPAAWAQLGGQESAGEGVIVGVLDSGIWPEHPSFADPDPSGNAYPPPPVAPGSNGFTGGAPLNTCNFGNTAYNVYDVPFSCNNKLIGAYDFTQTYSAVVGLLPTEFDSARDADGHGTHTSTTSAGNGGVAANIFGTPLGTVSGIAPRAHVIGYKVCGAEGCFGSDSVAAVDQAILDGVDVINFSISGGNSPYSDAVSLAFLLAYDAGVLVTPSAGNSGPAPDTVAHREPWSLTIGASTSDRHFLSTLTLTADNGDTLDLVGATITAGISTPTPVVIASDTQCTDAMAPGTFSGEIVICERGVFARVLKSFNAAQAGAGGMILRNPSLQGLNTDNHFIPSVHLDVVEGDALLAFMGSHSGVVGTFTDGAATLVQGDVMAAFSSRGGSGQVLGVSKPDVTAPGVQILAGHTPLPATAEGGIPGQLFQSIQGTSMSAPHAAGAAAIVKAQHPDWTPGQIKSAMMLSALTAGVTKEDGVTPADAFDLGSGRIDMAVAGNVSVTMDESALNYLVHENDLWNTNYPSVYVPAMPGAITVMRTFTNVTNKNQEFNVSIASTPDMTVEVGQVNSNGIFSARNSVKVLKNSSETFAIRISAPSVPLGEVRHARITFDNKGSDELLTMPVTIVRDQPATLSTTKSCDPTTVSKGGVTTCTITMTNNSFDAAAVGMIDRIPQQLSLVRGSVQGGQESGNDVVFSGSLYGQQPPVVNAAVDPLASPAGYLPLALFGSTVVGASDESITNFNVPSFTYAGQSYSQIGIVSNGYLVVGGGTNGDVDYINSDLPDVNPPNNVLAPFWTDLNPSAGGRILVNVLGNGTDSWTVVEWENVPNWGDGEVNTFQVWIGTNTDSNPGEDISFTYGPSISDGDGGYLTVGAENVYGNSGQTVYFDGAGTAPAPSYPSGNFEVDVFSTPGTPGETVTVTFQAKGKTVGDWTNCAEVTADSFDGASFACVSGSVVK